MSRTAHPMFAIAALCTTLGVSCGGAASSTTAAPGGDGSVAASGSASSSGSQSGTTIKIGVVGPMTGDAAADGLHIKQGAQLAADQVNSGGGIASGPYKGARIVLDTIDDRETVEGAVAAANRVVSDTSYWALIGTGFSDAAIATAPVAERAQVPYLSTYASSDQILARPYKNVFIVPPTFPAYAFSAADRATKLGHKKVAILQANAAFGTHMADLFSQRLQQDGGTVVATETYTLGDKSVEGPVAKVKAANPDLVALAGLTGDDLAQIKALHAAGVTAPVIDLEAVLFSKDFLTAAGGDAQGVVGQTPSDPQRNTAPAQALRAAFTSAYGTSVIPDPAAFSYEAILAIATAMATGPGDRSALSGALHGTALADTGVGSLKFDSSGARLGGVLWYFTVKNGDFSFDTGYQQTAPREVKEVQLQR